jgi:hypothetical protein
VQVAHQGYARRIPVPQFAHHIVCFSERNKAQLAPKFPEASIEVILPHFKPAPRWKWCGGDIWTVLSRPETRHPMATAGVLEIVYLLNNPAIVHTWYGQHQSGGFLNQAEMIARQSACSAYLTMLPPQSGVGLTEHECMAAGVPLVGAEWGDIGPAPMDGDPMLLRPPSLFQFWNFDAITEEATRLMRDREHAHRSSEGSLAYVANNCAMDTMDFSIERLLQEWL